MTYPIKFFVSYQIVCYICIIIKSRSFFVAGKLTACLHLQCCGFCRIIFLGSKYNTSTYSMLRQRVLLAMTVKFVKETHPWIVVVFSRSKIHAHVVKILFPNLWKFVLHIFVYFLVSCCVYEVQLYMQVCVGINLYL